jgi:hypothetical protein
VAAKSVYKLGDLVGVPMRRVGKFIDSHPGCHGRDAGIPGIQMLMEVIAAETDHRDVHSLYAFGTQGARHGSRSASD